MVARVRSFQVVAVLFFAVLGLSGCSNVLQAFQDHHSSSLYYVSVEPTTGGPFPQGNSYQSGEQVTVAAGAGLTRTNYVFLRWNTKVDGKGDSYLPGQKLTMPPFDITLFAQWAATNNLTYDGNRETGGQPPTDAGAYLNGDPVTVQANVNGLFKAGWKFSGWNTRADGSGSQFSPAETFLFPSAPITLWARWTNDSVPTSTVSYDANHADTGNTPMDDMHYLKGSTATLAGAGNLIRVGYTFDGWNTKGDGTGTLYNFGQQVTMGTNDLVLFAKWTPQATPFTVTYNGNSQSTGVPPTDPASPYLVNQPVTPMGSNGLIRTGYLFTGWNTQFDGSGVHYSVGISFPMPATNLMLWADWKQLYTLTLDGNLNTAGPATQALGSFIAGSTASLPGQGSLAKTGSTFAGWNTLNTGMGIDFPPGNYTMPASNTILFAHWIAPPTYTITYNGNGGTPIPSDGSLYLSGDTVNVPLTPVPIRAGYVFQHWNDNAADTGTIATPGGTYPMPPSNITLWAIWQPTGDVYVTTGGNDAGTGNFDDPVRTIAHALAIVPAGKTVYVAPGHYNAPSGEVFPLVVPAGVVLQGDGTQGSTTFIEGGGEAVPAGLGIGGYSFALVMSSNSYITGFTITNNSGLTTYPSGILLHGAYGSDNVQINNVTVVGNPGIGLAAFGGYAGIVTGVKFQSNGIDVNVDGNLGGGSDLKFFFDSFYDPVVTLYPGVSPGPDFGGAPVTGSPGNNGFFGPWNSFDSAVTVWAQNNYWFPTCPPTYSFTAGTAEIAQLGIGVIDYTGAQLGTP